MSKLVAAIACRNNGSRLYAKPLQNLDILREVSILDNIVSCLSKVDAIDSIVLGVASGIENNIFVEYASSKNLGCIRGDENDVLSRLIKCGEYSNASDIFRMTSESPFPYFNMIDEAWRLHIKNGNDATFLDNIIDGANFEILSLEALIRSHNDGEDKHRSELCTLYIRENKEKFIIENITPPRELQRKDLRLTVDYPEDLIVCRAVYNNFIDLAPNIPINEIVNFLDENPNLITLTLPFCEEGYETMYL